MKNSHKQATGKHDSLCGIVKQILSLKGGELVQGVIYEHGELDVVHYEVTGNVTYYEIKSSNLDKNIAKGIKQVKRAMDYNMCNCGYVVTPTSINKI